MRASGRLLRAGAAIILVASGCRSGEHGHDVVDDTMSGLNGPVVSIEGTIDAGGQRGAILRVERRDVSASTRVDVEKTWRALEADVGPYSLVFMGSTGNERGSHGIGIVDALADGALHFRAATSLDPETRSITLTHRAADGSYRRLAAMAVEPSTMPVPATARR